MKFFCFCLILIIAVCSADSQTIYVNYDGKSYSIVDVADPSRQPAYASYNDTILENGWSVLRVTTNGAFDDGIQAYAAGFAEAYLTHHKMYQHYKNFFIESKFSEKLKNYINANRAFMDKLIESENEPFNYQLSLLLKQASGLTDGYKQFSPEEEKLSDDQIYHIIHYSDIRDLENILLGKLSNHDSCSALIKVLDQNDDIIITHTTWTKLTSMLRIWKIYTFPWKSHKGGDVVPSKVMAFSSYPGFLVSEDDFYMMSNGLVVQETTISNNNKTLNELYIKPNTVSVWMRNIIANRLSKTGSDWYNYFKNLNNGCYTNQYMIVDFKQFKIHNALGNNLLWIVEQIPGYTIGKDMTSFLRDQKFWPSYNSAYYPEIREMSNVTALEKIDDYYTYYNTSRAKIFRRDAPKVVDYESMRKMIRYNDFEHDEFSKCNCTPPYSASLSISARGDLNKADGIYPIGGWGLRNHAGTDGKLTSYRLFRVNMTAQIIAGPTSDQQPAFTWSTSPFKDLSHLGHPDTFNFPWQTIKSLIPESILEPIHDDIPDKTFTVWPLLKKEKHSGEKMKLHKDFKITAVSKSEYVGSAIKRYLTIIGLGKGESENDLKQLSVSTKTDDESLSLDTSYHYTLRTDGNKAEIVGDTPYAAMYGLETFSQLIYNGEFNYSVFDIDDEPEWSHRGMMLDTGRRFWPVKTMKMAIDSMSYLKLNVLHLHLTDWCRVALESKKFPMLTRDLVDLQAGYYTQEEMKDIIEYAKQRGVRIIPEFDVPGHSKGWSALSEVGMEFCDDRKHQLYGDAANKTLNVLMEYLSEVLPLFPEPYVHLGADELQNVGRCTSASFVQFEKYLFERIYKELGKRPIGWEETLFSAHSVYDYNVVNAWLAHFATEIINKGYDSIESYGGNFYMNHVDYVENWVDIRDMHKTDRAIIGESNNNNNEENNNDYGIKTIRNKVGRIFGGEVSMWTDNYLYLSQCGTASGKPVAWELYDPKYDDLFSESALSVVYPRGIKAAGSLYRYNSSYLELSNKFVEIIKAANDRLSRRGVYVCPNGCECNELSKCGEKYLDRKIMKNPSLGKELSKDENILQIVFGIIGGVGLVGIMIFLVVFTVKQFMKMSKNKKNSTNEALLSVDAV